MKILFCAMTFALVSAVTNAAGADTRPLTLEDAVARALEADDPSVEQFEQEARALEDRAVAESQLPDPQLGVTMQNLPTSLDFNQENMTQLQTKVRQAFPAGRTLELRGERRLAESRAAGQAAALQRLKVVRETRLSWLEMFYWVRAGKSIADSRRAVDELKTSITADYAAGRAGSQELMRTRLELSLLDDRLIEAERRLEVARSDLARWIGEAAARRELSTRLPVLKHPEMRVALRERLGRHPALLRADSLVSARGRDIEIAEQQYKPDWAVELGYGFRDGNRLVGSRDDFITAGVTLDIPLFTGRRQDRAVSASKREQNAARLSRQTLLLELRRQLERDYAAWTRLGERIRLYEEAVLARAAETTGASRTSYRSGVTDFAELIRARLAELETELTLIRLRVDHAQTQARLLFLEGDL